MKIEIEISDKAYEVLKKTAEIKRILVTDITQEKFKFYEECARDPEKEAAHYKKITIDTIKKECREIYHKHRLQEFYINEPKNGKSKTIAWRTCPVQPDVAFGPEQDRAQHIGEYWYELRWYDDSQAIAPGFSHISKRQVHFRKTLKALKKAINKELGYDHYRR